MAPVDADTSAYIAGVFLSVLTACVNSCGMGLQKRVHLDLALLPAGAVRAYWRDRRWVGGLVCMAVASGLVLVNYALLGQARASAMSSMTIVTNAVMAKHYLHESFTRVDAGATALIIAGIVVAVVFGAQGGGGTSDDLAALLADLSNDTVYVSSACIVVAVVALSLFVRRSEAAGAAAGARGAECFARALLAGIFSGSTGFFAKAVTYAARASIAAHDARGSVANGFFYIFLVGLPFSIFMQLKTLNEGLRAFDAIEIVPMYQASIVCVGVSWGWTFYQENRYLDRAHEAMFAVGCAVSVCGILLLSFKKALAPRAPRASFTSGSAAGAGDAAGAAAAAAAPGARAPDAKTALLGGFAASGVAYAAQGATFGGAAARPLASEGSFYGGSDAYLRLDSDLVYPDSLVLPPLG